MRLSDSVVLGPVANTVPFFDLDLAALEKCQKALQKIAESKVRNSRFDARILFAVGKAAELLEAAGIVLTRSRDGEFNNLSAALWGTPGRDFREHLKDYSGRQRKRTQAGTP